jgi:hypothetical protein
MDFVIDLSPSRLQKEVYDSILVIINHFTKLDTYIPYKKSINAEELVDIVTKRVFNIYGYPNSIITNQGSLFTSGFWSKLMYQFGIKRQLSTAFHPQTDSQIERLNQVIEHYLRCYTNQRQDDWAQHLSAAQFAYNNSKHASTRTTPLRSLVSFDPKPLFKDHIEPSIIQTTQEHIEKLKEIREQVKLHLEQAIAVQAIHYNK